jgi:DNA-binding PadR family transcriptional regulator
MSLRRAILGFLSLEPTSGYTLKQRFEGSVGSFWTATQSQIYRELHGLEGNGLVAVESVRGTGKPDRKVYSLTPAGRADLTRWLREPLDPLTLRHPLLLKLVFAAELAPHALDALLETYSNRMTATRAQYAARLHDPRIFSLARSARERSIWRLAVAHGIAWCDSELTWIARARAELGGQKGKKDGTQRQSHRGHRRLKRLRPRVRPTARG